MSEDQKIYLSFAVDTAQVSAATGSVAALTAATTQSAVATDKQAAAQQGAATATAQATTASRRKKAATDQETAADKQSAAAADAKARALRTAATAATGAGNSAGRAAQTVLGLSRAAQDVAQGGLAAGLNNLEQIFAGLPGRIAGLAPVVTMLGTAAYVLYNQWDNLMALVGKRVAIPEPDASSLDGLIAKLKDVQGQIDELEKRKLVTPEEAGKLAELRDLEKQLEKDRETLTLIERLKDARSEAQDKVAQAFQNAFKEQGAQGLIETIEKEFVAAFQGRLGLNPNDPTAAEPLRRAGAQAKDQLLKLYGDLAAGSKEAFKELSGFVATIFGPDSEIAKALKEMDPATIASNKSSAWIEKENERLAVLRQRNRERRREETRQLTEAGEEAAREWREGIVEETEHSLGQAFQRQALALATKGAGFKDRLKDLAERVKREMAGLFPVLEQFPDVLAQLARDVAANATKAVEKTIEELMAAERMTREQALRRLEQQEKDRTQDAAGGRAADAFRALAEKHGTDPRQAKDVGANLHQIFKDVGLTGEQQEKAAGILSDPNNLRQFGGLVDTMQSVGGLDHGRAIRAALEKLGAAQGRQVDPIRATLDAMNELMHNQERLMNAWAHQDRRAREIRQGAMQLGRMAEMHQRSAQLWGR